MAISEVLLPCPFCGGEAEMIVGSHNFRDAMIRCTECNAEGPLFDGDDADSSTVNELAAKRHWNVRARSLR